MPDVMFVRGYGFPRGSKMDYAGMGGFGGYGDAIDLPEASLFDPIPALDGYSGYGDTTLPTLDLSAGAPPPSAQAGYGASGALGLLPLAGLALIAFALFGSGK